MHYLKIILLSCFLALMSCGKSPLLNKVKNGVNDVAGNASLSENFPKEKVSFSYKWTTPPSLEVLSAFEINLSSPLKSNQSLNAYIWMPDMGHGSSPITINQLNSTDYSFTDVAFIMPGLWVLHIEILENNVVIDQWQKSITL